jgi:hypothetical protein
VPGLHTPSRHQLRLSCWPTPGRIAVGVLACLALLAADAPVVADPKPLSKEEQARIDKTIDRAIAFVKSEQLDNGEFKRLKGTTISCPRGQPIFVGWALLECGVPANDPCVQRIAAFARGNAPKLDETYAVALAVLFLDRLGDPQDEELIRDLALRLIAWQTYTGGWNYATRTVSEANLKQLRETLRALETEEEGRAKGAGEKKAMGRTAIPPRLKSLAVFQNPRTLFRRPEVPPPTTPDGKGRIKDSTLPYVGAADNSNTQFALLALWAARRHGVPLGRTFRLVEERFNTSQNGDGTWSYYYFYHSRPPNVFELATRKLDRAMTTVGLLGLAIAHGLQPPPQDAGPVRDERIVRGFAALSREIGEPSGQMDRKLIQQDLYFLWSVERVAALYKLPLIGEKDWYRWGAEILVTNQLEDGSWGASVDDPKKAMMGYGGVNSACFALLFLKQVNLTKDLTAKLPFDPRELNRTIAKACHFSEGGSPTPDRRTTKP